MRCYYLTPEEACRLEDYYRPLLECAIAKAAGRVSWAELFENIRAAKSSVWLVEQDGLCGVFTIAIHPSQVRWAEVEFLAGEHAKDWLSSALEAVERYLSLYEVQQLVFTGSEGLKRITKDLGFETRRIEAVKRLT